MNSAICPFCSCGCRLYPRRSRYKKLSGLIPLRKNGNSYGTLCIRGWHSYEYMTHSERLKAPLIKKNNELKVATWDESLKTAADKLKEIIKKYGSESVAFIGSPNCSNEDNYVLMKFARNVICSGNIDTKSRICTIPILEAIYGSLGAGYSPPSLNKLEDADFIFVVGTDVMGSCPQAASRIFKAIKNGAKLAVVDPNITNLAKVANYHLQNYPGTDLYWINGMLSHLIKINNIKSDFISSRTTGFAELKKSLEEFTPSFAEQNSYIPENILKTVSEELAKANKAFVLIGDALSHNADIKSTTRGLINLCIVTGIMENDSSGIMLVDGCNNTRGTWDMGVLPDRFPGGIPMDSDSNSIYPKLGFKTESRPGLNYHEILNGIISGRIKALYLIGDDLLTFSSYSKELTEALEKLELFIAQDILPNETNLMADIVFPASASFERAGTVTNLENRIQYFSPILEPCGESKPDWQIIFELSKAMGTDFEYKNVDEILKEIADFVPGYDVLKNVNIKDEIDGIYSKRNWDVDYDIPEFKKDWKEKIIVSLPSDEDKIQITDEYPQLLVSYKFPTFWGTGNRSSRVNYLHREENRSFILIHSEDAKKFNVRGGWRVKVIHDTGTIETTVSINDDLPKGISFLPLHKKDGNLQNLSFRPLKVRIESC
ncbi:molybdopterin-dependent oxidoreductase [bacterium]|nr:molybdopterin-dependent oxidoreductase [bacterium]